VKQKIGHTLKHRWKGDTSPTMSRHSLEHGNPLEIVSALLICIHGTPLSALDLDRTSQILFHYTQKIKLEIVSALLICIHDTPLSALDLDRTSQILFHYA
jgi:hypothetical protein